MTVSKGEDHGRVATRHDLPGVGQVNHRVDQGSRLSHRLPEVHCLSGRKPEIGTKTRTKRPNQEAIRDHHRKGSKREIISPSRAGANR